MIPRPIQPADGLSVDIPLSEDAPDYVYRKALQLKKEDKAFSPEYDADINTVLGFFHAMDDLTEDRHDYLRRRYPAIYGAIELKIDPNDLRDCLIEAGVLGGATYENLSAVMGMAEETIEEYEKIFFDVRDKMQYPGFIYGRVLNMSENVADPESVSVKTVWRMLGYHLGWEFVQDEISQYNGMVDLVVQQERMKTLVASLIEDADPGMILDRNLNSSSNQVAEKSETAEVTEAEEYYEMIEKKITAAVSLEPAEIDGEIEDTSPEEAQQKLLQSGTDNES